MCVCVCVCVGGGGGGGGGGGDTDTVPRGICGIHAISSTRFGVIATILVLSTEQVTLSD